MTASPVQTATSTALPQPIINAEPRAFSDDFNQRPFTFSHNLAGHPLFELPRLADLAETLVSRRGKKAVACRVSDQSVTRKWGDAPPREQVADSLLHIKESGSWVLLKHAQEDPEYQALLEQILVELEALTGVNLQEQITFIDAYIFIASPRSITQYHIDHESNFLFQIHGDKENNLFDQNDRSVLTEQELEEYYIGNLDAAKYHPGIQSKATIYPLSAGIGLHHPVNAPHWVKTGDKEFAISLSILFFMRPFDFRGRVYQWNYYLRKFGFKPRPPGQSKFIDWLKISSLGLLTKRQPITKDDVLRSGIRRFMALRSARKHTDNSLRHISFSNAKTAATKFAIHHSDQILKLPIIRDLNGYFRFPRIANGFRGCFESFEKAQAAVPTYAIVGYDTASAHKSRKKTFDHFNPSDRPLLPHLNRALAESHRVFDLGGSIGQGYYTYQNHVQYPPHLQWQVCEVSSAVAAGTQFAQEKGATNLSFTTQSEAADGADVFITCGALQYIQPSLAEILAPLGEKPRHLFIARVPFYDGPEYFTLQSILASKRPYKLAAICPYKIQNRDQFIGDLEALGYELVESWKNDRTCVIPFHPQRFVDGYHSFYFRRGDA